MAVAVRVAIDDARGGSDTSAAAVGVCQRRRELMEVAVEPVPVAVFG